MASDEGDVEALIAGRFPVIVIETHEESRALSLVRRAAARRGLTVRTWSVTRGLQTPAGTGALVGTQDPAVALRTIAGEREPGIVVLLDFHPFLSNPVHVRQIKEIAADYDAAARTVVLLGHQAEVPPEIAKLSARLELALPDNDAILRIVKEEVLAWQKAHDGADLKGEREVFDVFLRHLSGLTELDVRRLVRYAIQDDGLLGREDLPRARDQGNARSALAGAAKLVEAEYESPYLNHATLEPQTCTAWLKPEGFLEVWTSTQNGEASMASR